MNNKLLVVLAVLAVVSFGVAQDDPFASNYAEVVANNLGVDIDSVRIDCPAQPNDDVVACLEMAGSGSFARTVLRTQLSQYEDVEQLTPWTEYEFGYGAMYLFGENGSGHMLATFVSETPDLTWVTFEHSGYVKENGEMIENPKLPYR